ncbi:hypothetical protein C8R44DRAFT_616997 [Mycena epipterygia]|nr:hypothetical protein C8R44DRAFT_616997 [Mycena epipterygia]
MRFPHQFLSPVAPPPSIRRYHKTSARSDPGPLGGGSNRGGASSQWPSPYRNPNVSSQPRYDNLPDVGDGAPIIVSKQNVTTVRTSKASHNRRKQAAFICPVPGCGSTFTRSFNLKGHIRSHNEEKPFLCKWPGCGKGFAREHDCKRHEQLHANYRPFTCDGCNKQFARMEALNRHCASEGGAECQRTIEADGRMPDLSRDLIMPWEMTASARFYSGWRCHVSSESPPPPSLRVPLAKVEDPWTNMTGVAL